MYISTKSERNFASARSTRQPIPHPTRARRITETRVIPPLPSAATGRGAASPSGSAEIALLASYTARRDIGPGSATGLCQLGTQAGGRGPGGAGRGTGDTQSL